MITLRSITLENFGPYRENQHLKLGPGVTVVEGGNGHGKSSLFRALRFALYGPRDKTLPRADSLVHDRPGSTSGPLKVVVEFTELVAGAEIPFVVTREHHLGDNATSTIVVRDFSPLSAADGDSELERLFPLEMSDFVFFDAERLQQYQFASAGEKTLATRDAIEQLTGLPVLAGAHDHVGKLASEATDEIRESDAAKRGEADLTADLEIARVGLASVSRELEDRIKDLKTAEDAHAAVERDLENFSYYRKLAEERAATLIEMKSAQAELDEEYAHIRELAPRAWVGPVEEMLREKQALLRNDMATAAEDLGRRRLLDEYRDHLSTTTGCPLCEADLDDARRMRTLDQIRHNSPNHDELLLLERITGSSTNLAAIDRVLVGSPSAEITRRSKSTLAIHKRIADHEAAIRDLKRRMDQTGHADQDYQKLIRSESTLESQKRVAQESVADAEERKSEKAQAVDSLQRKLMNSSAAAESPQARKDYWVTLTLGELFAEAIPIARSKLQNLIETAASEFFSGVSDLDGHDGLVLDAEYRATIVDKEGRATPSPSSGYQNLVVLSLVSALMRTSPTPGPVLMDMPFGRLDTERTADVVRALPELSSQVVIFVFPGEFAHEDLTDIAKSVNAVYRITRRGDQTSSLENQAVRSMSS